MRLPPPDVIAAWPTPNYEDPVTRGPTLIIVNSVFLAIVTVVVGLRTYTRLILTRAFGLDDAFICLALVFTLGLNIAVNIGTKKYGWDRHVWDVPPDYLEPSGKLIFSVEILFLLSSSAANLSVICLYYRLIRESSNRYLRYVVHFSLVLVALYFGLFFMLQMFICTPISKYWTFPPIQGKCIDEGKMAFAGGLIKTSLDLLLTTLPIPVVLQIKMPKARRYGLAVLFGLGYIVTAAGAVRTYYTWKMFYATWDITWYQSPPFLAMAVENDLLVICACIPTLRPLFRSVFGGIVSTVSNTYGTKGSREVSNRPAKDYSRMSSGAISEVDAESAGKTVATVESRSFELEEDPKGRTSSTKA